MAAMHSRTHLLAAALLAALPTVGTAEDIDIFVGGAGSSGAANVLVIIDNTANWASSTQNWPGGITQGQAEVIALKNILPSLNETINVGLMMLTNNGSGNCCSGGYIRFAMQPMSDTNRTTLAT